MLKFNSIYQHPLRTFIGLIIVIFLATFIYSDTADAATGINRQINFQGKVVNSDGTNVPDGNYDFEFKLYTVDTAGTAIWTETRTTANQVAVQDGVFRVSLGEVTALPGSVDFNTDNIYLAVNFNSDGEMSPRVRFTAVPYAFNAEKVAGLTVTNTNGTLTIPDSTITFSGANDVTLTSTGATTLTLPTTGTLATLAGAETFSNKTIDSTGLTVQDNTWIGLGSGTGRIEFDDQTIDEVNILGANVGIGTSAPTAMLDVEGLLTTNNLQTKPALGSYYYEDTTGLVYDVAVVGEYAYIADGTGGLRVIDISNPTDPVTLGTYNSPGTARGIDVKGSYAYLADGIWGFRVVDVSNPNAPALVGECDCLNDAYDVIVSGKYAYVADRSSGTRVFDISDPTLPVLITTYNGSGLASTLAIQDNYLFVNDDSTNGMIILDISDPTSPSLVGGPVGYAVSIAVNGRYAYISAGSTAYGISVVDISNPASPTIVGSVSGTLYSNGGLTVVGNYLYAVTQTVAEIILYDVSDPTSPAEIDKLQISGGVVGKGIVVNGNYAYAATGDTGLVSVELQGAVLPTLSSGSITTNFLNILGNGTTNGDFSVRGGLNVGHNALIDGRLAVVNKAYFGNNVGIGTTDPTRLLHVAGSMRLDTVSTPGTPVAGDIYSDGTDLFFYNGSTWDDLTGAGGGGTSYWGLSNGALSPLSSSADVLIGSTASSSAKLAFLNINSGTPTASISAGLSGGLFLTADGILSTTASQTLSLGSTNTGNITFNPAGSTAATFLQNGYLGLGTTAPGYKLDLTGNQNITGDLYFTRASQVFNPSIEQISTLGTGNIDIAARGNVSMYIDSNNNGTNYFAVFGNGTSSQLFSVLDGGNVGIGTAITSPTAYLDIAGSEASRASLRLRSSATPPTTPNDGDIYYDTAKDSLMLYTGSKWQADRSSATLIVAANDSLFKDRADYVADGTADQAEIEAAITALPAGGGVVVLLEGTYSLSDDVTITKSNVKLLGSGTATILSKAWDQTVAETKGAITLGEDTSTYTGIEIRSLTLLGNKATYTDVDNYGVYIAGKVNESTVADITINDFAGAGIFTKGLGETNTGNVFSKNIIKNGGSYGIYLNYNNRKTLITDNYIYSNGNTGVYLRYDEDDSQIVNNRIESNTGAGIYIYQASSRLTISGNQIITNTSNGIAMNSGSDNPLISGNVVSGNGDHGIYLTSVDQADISGNMVIGNTGRGISIFVSNYANITGNTVNSNTTNGIRVDTANYTNITSNNLYANTGSGTDSSIYLTSSDNNSISGNRIVDTAGTGYAINISNSASDTNYLASNYYTGTGATAINNAGTGTIYGGQTYGSDYVIAPTGNVGISTTAPARLLHVAGAMRLTSTTTPGTPVLGDLYTNADGNLYFYNGSTWDDLTGGGASYWGLTENVLHPSNEYAAIADLIIGGTSTASADFQVIGSGANAGYVYGRRFVDIDSTSYYVEPGNTTTAAIFAGNVGIGTTTITSKLDIVTTANQDILQLIGDSVTTSDGIDLSVDGLTTGYAFNAQSTSTALTTGGLLDLDWTPGAVATASGDLFRLQIGAHADLTGNMLALYDSGNAIFKVSTQKITSALPHEFTAAGDVSMAYDLILTNQTSSHIESNGPLTITSGENFENLDLTLQPSGSGAVVIDDGSNLELYADQQLIFDTDDGGNSYIQFDNTNNRVEIFADGSERFRFTASGNNESNGTITTTLSDVAENYPTLNADLEAGDVVVVTSQAESGVAPYLVDVSSVETKDLVVGVVSSKPGLVLGGSSFLSDICQQATVSKVARDQITLDLLREEYKISLLTNLEETERASEAAMLTEKEIGQEVALASLEELENLVPDSIKKTIEDRINSCDAVKQVPIALAGRVPVKFDRSAGDIKPGDLLMVSPTLEGHAVKATGTGWVIGRALEANDKDSETIMMFVSLSWYTGINSLENIADFGNDVLGSSISLDSAFSIKNVSGSDRAVISLSTHVMGDLSANSITALDGFSTGMTSYENNEITTVDGSVLKLQTGYGAGNIEAFNKNIVMTSDGGIVAAETISAKRFAGSDASRGSVFATQTKINVNQEWDVPPASITLTPEYQASVWVSDISKDGFVINASSINSNKRIFWWAVW